MIVSRRAIGVGGAFLAALAWALLLAPEGGLERLPWNDPFLAPSFAHPLGTDDLGRDMLKATVQGLRTSFLVGTGVAGLALVCGMAVGLAAALGPRLLDELLMHAADVVASLPVLLVAILVAALFSGTTGHLILVLGLLRWPLTARLTRIEALSLRNREFVRAAHALGASSWRLVIRHIMPHTATVALSSGSALFSGAVVTEASLAFVGLGDPAVTSLGQLAASGFAFVTIAPWLWIAPVAALSLTAALVAVLADSLSGNRLTGG